MSSVITDMIDCPQCGLPAVKSEFYVTGEEEVACDWCGYSHTKTLTGTASSKGYGTVHYVRKDEDANGSNEVRQIVRLKMPTSIIDRHKTIMEIQEKYDTEKSGFYVWSEETSSLECLLGKKPKTIDEVYEEEKEKALYYQQVSSPPFSEEDGEVL